MWTSTTWHTGKCTNFLDPNSVSQQVLPGFNPLQELCIKPNLKPNPILDTIKDGVTSRSTGRWTYIFPLWWSSIENNPISGNSSTPGPLIKYISDTFFDILLKSWKEENRKKNWRSLRINHGDLQKARLRTKTSFRNRNKPSLPKGC